MKRLKMTNAYASKLTLAKREAIINGARQPSAPFDIDGVGAEKKLDPGLWSPNRRQAQ